MSISVREANASILRNLFFNTSVPSDNRVITEDTVTVTDLPVGKDWAILDSEANAVFLVDLYADRKDSSAAPSPESLGDIYFESARIRSTVKDADLPPDFLEKCPNWDEVGNDDLLDAFPDDFWGALGDIYDEKPKLTLKDLTEVGLDLSKLGQSPDVILDALNARGATIEEVVKMAGGLPKSSDTVENEPGDGQQNEVVVDEQNEDPEYWNDLLNDEFGDQ